MRPPDLDPLLDATRGRIKRPDLSHDSSGTLPRPVACNLIARFGERMIPFLIVGLGGFLGANCRALVGGWAGERFGVGFPFGTLLINVTGCFVIGLFLTLLSERLAVPPSLRLFFVTGFLGAYTTFSTFAFESVSLLESRALLFAAANLLGSVLLGVIAVLAGIMVSRLV
ncbi:MAG: fluoride efflux transporter CrcB [Chloroflexota bacterium]